MDLEALFHKLLATYTQDKNLISILWKVVHKQYSEKHRAYHNLTHITEIFNYLNIYKNHITDIESISFSIFYHDVIYSIWKKDNEDKSADFAINHLSKLGLDSYITKKIHQQIMATKTHVAIDNDTKWMVDFDLGILGSSDENYTNYTKLIRKEYAVVPYFIYKKGRKKVLQHFIDKPHIYATEHFRTLYEKQARINLTNELNRL